MTIPSKGVNKSLWVLVMWVTTIPFCAASNTRYPLGTTSGQPANVGFPLVRTPTLLNPAGDPAAAGFTHGQATIFNPYPFPEILVVPTTFCVATMMLGAPSFHVMVFKELPLKSSSGNKGPPEVLLPNKAIVPEEFITTRIKGFSSVPVISHISPSVSVSYSSPS